MGWKTKSRIQNAIDRLPSGLGNKAYYMMQRRFGRLRHVDPVSMLVAGVEVCKRIAAHGGRTDGATFFEVGTGWRLNMPIAFWLLGAGRVITVDLNPYLRPELVAQDIEYIRGNAAMVRGLFEELPLDRERFDRLLELGSAPWEIGQLLELCRIEYIAPGDAASLDLPAGSIDVHTSYNVVEHVPPAELRRILVEGNRLMRDGGLFVHRVDYSDHFAHTDESISFINFLQYSDRQWAKLAGNRRMYANRLRVDDVEKLYRDCGHAIVSIESTVDPRSRSELDDPAFRLDGRFAGKPATVLATIDSWIVSTGPTTTET